MTWLDWIRLVVWRWKGYGGHLPGCEAIVKGVWVCSDGCPQERLASRRTRTAIKRWAGR